MERFFFRESDRDKWHWMASCPAFPGTTRPEIVKSSRFPEPERICMHCLAIEMKDFKENFFYDRKQGLK